MIRSTLITGPALAMALLFAATRVGAQQDPMYNQYMFNTLAFNPAYAGSAEVFTVMALSRHQWVGFDGAPATQTLLAHTPLKAQKLGVGMTLIADKIGPTQQTSVFTDLAYRIQVTEGSQLSFGLKGGFNILRADLASLSTVEVDPANVNIQGRLLPNFGFGLFWHSRMYYVGLSAPKLLQNDLSALGDGMILASAQEKRHYFLIGGYVMDLNRDLKFKPSVMLRAVAGAPVSLDLNANFLLRERIWFGALYRVGNAFGLLGQYQVNDQLRVGYAFDLTTTRLAAYNAGTHEIMLSYDLRFIQGRTISPRYF
jgi:type IX secretion system PorP/SprF family membrane protein